MRKLARNPLVALFIALPLFASCATPPVTETEPLTPQSQPVISPNASSTVLQYAGEPAASGSAEHVTITDSANNTLYDQQYVPGESITLTVPRDGKLFISTKWTQGRTRQELNVASQGSTMLGAGEKISIALSPQTQQFRVDLPAVSRVPVLGPLLLNRAAGATVTPAQVIIQDSAGRTLYQGAAKSSGMYAVDATDGTLRVTTQWSDGTQTSKETGYSDRHVFFDDWDEYVVLQWDAGSNQYSLRKPGLLRGFELRTGFGELEDSAPSIGVVTGADTPLHEGPGQVHFRQLELGATLGRWGGFHPKLALGLSWGDEANASSHPGVSSGWAYQGGAPSGGGTGIFSSGGTTANFETDYKAQKLDLTLSAPLKDEDDSKVFLEYLFGLERLQREYTGRVELISFPGVTSTDRQELVQYTFHAGVGVRGRHYFASGWRLTGGVGASAAYVRGEYEGSHQYVCPPCAPAEQNFTQSTRDNDSGFTWGLQFNGRIGYPLQRRGEVFLGLDYRYQDKAFQLRNRTAPTDPAPRLYVDGMDWYSVQLGLQFAF